MNTILDTIKNKVFKKKESKTQTGRIYIRLDEKQAHCAFELADIIENKNKQTLIIQLGKGKRKTSLRRDGKHVHGLIDLRDKSITNVFKGCHLIIKIYDDVIIIEGTKDTCYVQDIAVDMMVAENYNSSTTRLLFSQIPLLPTERKKIAQGVRVASLFAGMGGLDYGFKESGYNLIFALDKPFYKETKANKELFGGANCSTLEDYHIQTYKRNVGHHIVAEDILTCSIEQFPAADVYLAGIPCQELSSVSRNRNNFHMLPKFFNRFIEIIEHARSTCKVFVIENSNNLLKAGREFLELLKKRLHWFHITENNIDAADFGSAQHRKRAIIIGCVDESIELHKPLITLPRTVGIALAGLNDSIPNQLDFSVPKEETILRMQYVPEGGNGAFIPEALRTGQFANSYKRLDSKEKSCAIANVRKSCIMPPFENRILSIRECLRLFDLPDSFICLGTLAAKQQMVANSVPLYLSKAIANTLLDYFIKRECYGCFY